MLRQWITPRLLLGLVSVGLIVAGLSRMVEIRSPNRPEGTWEDFFEVRDRQNLNVVFVMIDTLRADRLSAYGYERPTSPIFDALADSGILFRDVMAQSTWTKTSMASLWTSTYPASNRITRYPHGLPESVHAPTEILKEAGYRTVGIWRNGWVAPNFGFDQGFDLYFRPPVSRTNRPSRDNPSAFQLPGTDHDITQSAVQFLRTMDHEPFFLYLHYMDLHQYVYDDSADFGTTFSDIYDNSIRWTDANVGTVVATLQEEELMERTLLLISSDHGEAFHEHGIEGHARNLYRETTAVPLLIALPVRLAEGIQVKPPVENVDIWPTLLDLLELPPLPNAQGRSLVPLIEAAAQGAEEADGARPRYSQLDQTWGRRGEEPDPLVSMQKGRFRIFHKPGKPERDELYEVESDPYEQEDLAEERPELVEELRQDVHAYLESPAPRWGGPMEVQLDDFELGQLRALGYAIGGEPPEDRDLEGAPEAPAASPEEPDAPQAP